MNVFLTLQNQLQEVFPNSRLKLNEPLSNHTYIKIGGPAKILVQANSQTELIFAYQTALNHQIPVFILGGGSNVIFSDSGFAGLVIKNRTDTIKLSNFSGDVKHQNFNVQSAILEAQSGVITNHLVRYSIEQGLAGLEYFLGLPGTIGGAIFNNSHFKHQLIGNLVYSVKAMDANGKTIEYLQNQLEFAYDYSRFHNSNELILSAKFILQGGDKKKLWRKATQFAKERAQTQPLSFPSSGCMFKNLTASQAKKLNLPTNSTGYLIDQLGLKGARIGNAAVSDKHANFIINLGGATAEDVKTLVNQIQNKVWSKYKIMLEKEVIFINDKSIE